jgi:6-phosphogluconolactonase
MTRSGEPEIVVLPDAVALATAAADRVVDALGAAVRERREAHFAVSGGSSPVALYRELAARRTVAPWRDVHLWWVDDRYVPPDHPESNVALVRETLLEADVEATRGADIPAANVHMFPVLMALEEGHDPGWAARIYAEEILRHVPAPDGRPVFDVMVLGVGLDGHVMSLFPGSPGLADDAPLALAVPAPDHVAPHLPRVTLRGVVADDARLLLVIVPDGAKASVVAEALTGPPDALTLPARIARRAGATWMLTQDAAARLGRPLS